MRRWAVAPVLLAVVVALPLAGGPAGSASEARAALAVDRLVQQGGKLTGTGAVHPAGRGISVALSADGNTALVGGSFDNAGKGAVWVFVRSGMRWSQQGAKLTARDETGNGRFGTSVALSADGNTALVGGPADSGFRGAVWVFTRSGSKWSQQGAKLTGRDEAGSGKLGSSVALSADGSVALAGGTGDDGGKGAAWAFMRFGTSWSQERGKMVASDAVGPAALGGSVALSADGRTALVGGAEDGTGAGAAWVFLRPDKNWEQQSPKLTGFGEVGKGRFGSGVALSADGLSAVVGGERDDGPSRDLGAKGAFWTFTRTAQGWLKFGLKLTPGDENGLALFGRSVALSGDGKTVIVGGSSDNGRAGAVWVYRRGSFKVLGKRGWTPWKQDAAKLTGGGEVGAGRFGESTAISAGGGTALVGGPVDRNSRGAAWAFAAVPVAP